MDLSYQGSPLSYRALRSNPPDGSRGSSRSNLLNPSRTPLESPRRKSGVVKVQPTQPTARSSRIPPTEVGGSLRSNLLNPSRTLLTYMCAGPQTLLGISQSNPWPRLVGGWYQERPNDSLWRRAVGFGRLSRSAAWPQANPGST